MDNFIPDEWHRAIQIADLKREIRSELMWHRLETNEALPLPEGTRHVVLPVWS